MGSARGMTAERRGGLEGDVGEGAGGRRNAGDGDVSRAFQRFIDAGSGGETSPADSDIPQMFPDSQGCVYGHHGIFRVPQADVFQGRFQIQGMNRSFQGSVYSGAKPFLPGRFQTASDNGPQAVSGNPVASDAQKNRRMRRMPEHFFEMAGQNFGRRLFF